MTSARAPLRPKYSMQGIRGAVPQDLVAIKALLLPLEERGILAPRSDAQLLSDLRFFRVAERDANVSTVCKRTAFLFHIPSMQPGSFQRQKHHGRHAVMHISTGHCAMRILEVTNATKCLSNTARLCNPFQL